MQFDIIEHADDLLALKDEWTQLPQGCSSPVFSFEWQHAAALATSLAMELAFLTLRKNGALCALAPLAKSRRKRLPTLEFVGEPKCNLNEPSEFLCRDEESAAQLLDYTLKQGLPIRLERIPVGSMTMAAVARPTHKALILKRRRSESPYLAISGSWNDFMSSWSKNRRRQVKRSFSAAKSFGEIRYEIDQPNSKTLLGHLSRFFDIEASGWKGRQKSAIAMNVYAKRFWEVYCESLMAQDALRVSTLYVDRIPIAAQLGAIYNNRYWALKIAHDEDYNNTSPGFLLTHDTVRYCFENGFEAYEFMGEPFPWKMRWTSTSHEYRSYQVYPVSLTSMASLSYHTVGKATKALSSLKSRKFSSFARP